MAICRGKMAVNAAEQFRVSNTVSITVSRARDCTEMQMKSGVWPPFKPLDQDLTAAHRGFSALVGRKDPSFLLLGDGTDMSLEKLRTTGRSQFRGVGLLPHSASQTARGGHRAKIGGATARPIGRGSSDLALAGGRCSRAQAMNHPCFWSAFGGLGNWL